MLKRVLWGTLFSAVWLGSSWLLREPILATLIYTFSPNPRFSQYESGPILVAYWLARFLFCVLIGSFAVGVRYLLETCSAGEIVPERYRKMSKIRPEREPLLARLLFFLVVFFAVAPARWLSWRWVGGPALGAVALTLLGIHYVAGIGMGEAIGPIVKLDKQTRNPNGWYVLGVFLFVPFVLFMAMHLPYYGLGVFIGDVPFGEARRQLLMLHALVMWCALPMYVIGTHDREIILNFLKLNLWFVPWPAARAAKAARASGGASGGAGASGAF